MPRVEVSVAPEEPPPPTYNDTLSSIRRQLPKLSRSLSESAQKLPKFSRMISEAAERYGRQLSNNAQRGQSLAQTEVPNTEQEEDMRPKR